VTNRSLFAWLDDMVRWTGIPALAEGKPRRRPLRGPATLALVLAVIGYAVVLWSQQRATLGYSVLIVGFSIGNFMKLLGPLKPFGSIERVDEWDQAARSRSIVFTYMMISVTVPLGLLLLVATANLAGWDMLRLSQAVMATAFLLMTIFSALPTAHASWAVRWERDEDQN